MKLGLRARRYAAVFAATALLIAAAPAFSQEIAESHLKAARSAITALRVTEQFDNVLPQAAAALKAELIRTSPDMVQVIGQTVDEKALGFAARRGDLEREAANIYARMFTEPQLNEISAFYASDTGKKLLEDAPILGRELGQAAQIWQRGLARDLAEAVGEQLDSIVRAQAPGEGQAAPQGQSAPANQ